MIPSPTKIKGSENKKRPPKANIKAKIKDKEKMINLTNLDNFFVLRLAKNFKINKTMTIIIIPVTKIFIY